ncbi:hypothetical protein ACHAXS_006997 [Conticribra weissflogii]
MILLFSKDSRTISHLPVHHSNQVEKERAQAARSQASSLPQPPKTNDLYISRFRNHSASIRHSPRGYRNKRTPTAGVTMAHFDPNIDGMESEPRPRPAGLSMAQRRSISDSRLLSNFHAASFGSISRFAAYREIRQDEKKEFTRRQGWEHYDPNSSRTWVTSSSKIDEETAANIAAENTNEGARDVPSELSPLVTKSIHRASTSSQGDGEISNNTVEANGSEVHCDGNPWIALKEMFTDSAVNILFVFLPFAYYSHAAKWSDGSIFVLNFLAMIPLASMLGVFTEELAAHTNDVIGGLINATFGNAVELVVAIQALLAEDFRVVQASLIGSVFSNLLLVLGMCFFCGGLKYPEQEFIPQGAVASIALLGLNGLAMLLPAQFDNLNGGDSGTNEEDVTIMSRVGSILLVAMYGLMLFFQLKTHVYLFEGDDDVMALIPFHWALIGLLLITAIVTILSEYLVGSIDGFCEQFHIGRSFVGVIILPIVGNAVEHISAVSVAMKNKMDLALGGEFTAASLFAPHFRSLADNATFLSYVCGQSRSDRLSRSRYLFFLWL